VSFVCVAAIFAAQRYAYSAVLAVGRCLSVSRSVCHTSVF